MPEQHHPAPPPDPDAETCPVLLSRRDIADARRLFARIAAVSLEPSAEVPSIADVRDRRGLLLERARALYEERRLRMEAFGPAMFGEPAWDMLLLLYCAQAGARMTATRLAELSGSSRSTAFRWIDFLDGKGLIDRDPHETDRRMSFVQLSPKGCAALEAYLDRVRRDDGG